MADWLGCDIRKVHGWRPFKLARAYARHLGLKFHSDWKEYCKSGKKLGDIPTAPEIVYANTGWNGWGDWLGSGVIASQQLHYRTFAKARAFVRALGLRSRAEWQAYCRSGDKPDDIPASPARTYASHWRGMGDWLGTGRIHIRGWRPFRRARAYVRRLGLESQAEWLEYCKSGKKPFDIPIAPYYVYAGAGWVSWGDWLGSGWVATSCATIDHSLRRVNLFAACI
jgi:hypothetical protein